MVKSTTPLVSHKASDAEKAQNNSHPLRRGGSQAVDMMAAARARSAQEEMAIEQMDDWKNALNRMASSPDGQLFFRMMLRANNLFTPGTSRDTVKAVEDKQRQDFYLRHVRPYLDKSIRVEFE